MAGQTGQWNGPLAGSPVEAASWRRSRCGCEGGKQIGDVQKEWLPACVLWIRERRSTIGGRSSSEWSLLGSRAHSLPHLASQLLCFECCNLQEFNFEEALQQRLTLCSVARSRTASLA